LLLGIRLVRCEAFFRLPRCWLGSLLVVSLTSSCRDQSPETVDSRIKSSETLSRVDDFCQQLPKPPDFRFIAKIDGGNLSVVGISFLYNSDMTSEMVREFYDSSMISNGWRDDDGGRFFYKKENMRVSIESAQSPSAKYSVYCAEIK